MYIYSFFDGEEENVVQNQTLKNLYTLIFIIYN